MNNPGWSSAVRGVEKIATKAMLGCRLLTPTRVSRSIKPLWPVGRPFAYLVLAYPGGFVAVKQLERFGKGGAGQCRTDGSEWMWCPRKPPHKGGERKP